MKASSLLIIVLFSLAWRSAPAGEPAANGPVRLVIVGDSTVCNYPTNSVRRGWGMFIQDYFNRNQLQVINLALSGRSTKTFIQEGHWAEALSRKPDYVLIQFGHNDQVTAERQEQQTPLPQFKENLRRFVSEARAAGVIPVLVTPLTRRDYGPHGVIHSDLTEYSDALKSVAA